MASEPDDYQSISDNCPGYMVLISEGIICTRCAGEKRHKPNECPKPATAADFATDTVPGADAPPGTDNADSGMESLSDTESFSSESTAGSQGSDTRMDQGGSPQTTHLTRPGFARPDGSRTSTEPDRISPSPPNRRAAHQVPSSESRRSPRPKVQSRHDRDNVSGPNPLASAEMSSPTRSGATLSPEHPATSHQSAIEQRNKKTQRGSHAHHNPSKQVTCYEATEDRVPPKSLADTTGKFEYSNTTCPSSFGFGRLPSEAMG